MAFFGVDMQIRIEELILNFRNQIRTRGGSGLNDLRNICKTHDFNSCGSLDTKEFEAALAEFGLFPSTTDLKNLLNYYDSDGSGRVNIEKFVCALALDKLSPRVAAVDAKVWAKLDPTSSGSTDAKQVEVVLRKKEFMAHIMKRWPSGSITKADWYQAGLEGAMMHPNDDNLIKMMESVWDVCENEEAAVHQKQAMQVVALMRQRLITLSNGSQEEYHLRTIFRTFDSNNNGVLSLEELSGLLSKLGVDCQRKELIAVFKLLDGNNNGAIDFEEFNQFVIVDPYK